MTGPEDPGVRPPEAVLDLPVAEVMPGEPMLVPMTVTNQAGGPCRFALRVVGFEPSWVISPEVIGPLAPGQTVTVGIRVELPVGHPASHLVGKIEARPVDDGSGLIVDRPASSDLVLHVGDGNLVRAALEPSEVRGRSAARFALILQNRGHDPVRVDLSPVTTDDSMTVRFDGASQVLAPGAEVRVPGTVRAKRVVGGQRVRRPFGVRVQGRSTPVLAEGAMLQRPVVGSGVLKVGVWAMVLALWLSVVVVGATALDRHIKKSANATAASQQPVAPAPAPSAGTASGSGGSGSGGSGSGGSGSASGGSASGGSGGSGSGSGGSGSGSTSAGGSGSGGTSGAGGPTSVFSGTVTGPDPSGATVSVVSTPLVPASQLQSASTTGTFTSGPVGKNTAEFVDNVTTTPGTPATTPQYSVPVGPGGFWQVSGVPAPGDYLVTISKPGFGTQKFVVTTSPGGGPEKVDAKLVAGTGSVAGTISASGHPLGGADITITDGTVTLTTKTPTTGAVGSYQILGLTTPDTYEVQASYPGMGTQTKLVTLDAGGSLTGQDLLLKPGVGSITGTVRTTAQPNGAGGATVTASDGKTTVTATTSTVNPVGSYSLPNLPLGTKYTLSTSASGMATATEQVTLSEQAPDQQVNPTLLPSTSDVTGMIQAPTCVNGAATTAPAGRGDVGVVLASPKNTFKTLTASVSDPGSFDFGSIPPGSYVLTAEAAGYLSQSLDVTAQAGLNTQDVTLACAPIQSLGTGRVQVTVQSLATGKTLGSADNAHVTMSRCTSAETTAQCTPDTTVYCSTQATTTTTTPATCPILGNGAFTFDSVPPGIYTLTATAANYGTNSVSVSVPFGGTATAPNILLPELDELDLAFSSPSGPVQGTPTATIKPVSPVNGPTCTTDPTAQTTSLPLCQGAGYSSATQQIQITKLPPGLYSVTLGGTVCGSPAAPRCLYSANQPLSVKLDVEAPPLLYYVALQLDAVTAHVTQPASGGGTTPVPLPDATVYLYSNFTTQSCNAPSGSVASQTTDPSGNVTIGYGGAPGSSGTPQTDTLLVCPPTDGLQSQTRAFSATADPPVQQFLLTQNVSYPTISLTFQVQTPTGPQPCDVTPNGYTGPGGAACPGMPTGAMPTVTLNGSRSESGSPHAYSATASASGSCATATKAGECTYGFAAGDLDNLLPQATTIDVTDPSGAFAPPVQGQSIVGTRTVTPSTGTWDTTIALTPSPVGITGTLRSGSPSTQSTSAPIPQNATVTTTITPSVGTLSVDTTAARLADPVSLFNTALQQVGVVAPGQYQLKFKVDGFESPPPVTIVVPLLNTVVDSTTTPPTKCTLAACATFTATLASDFTLSLNPTFVGLTGTTPLADASNYLPVPTFTLQSKTGSNWTNVVAPVAICPTDYSAAQCPTGDDSGGHDFPSLSPNTTYQILVSAPGFNLSGTGFTTLASIWSVTDPTDGSSSSTAAPVLTLGPYITGTAEGVLNRQGGTNQLSALAGATVKACLVTTAPTCNPADSPISAVSTAGGGFVLTGDPGTTSGGLPTGTTGTATYDLAITAAPNGYSVQNPPLTAPVVVSAGGRNQAPAGPEVDESTIPLTVTVDEQVGSSANYVPAPTDALTVSASSPTGGRSVLLTCTAGQTVTTCTGSVDPTTYTVSVIESGFSTQSPGQLNLFPGYTPNPVVPFHLQSDQNAFSVTVTAAGTSVGLSGATVTVTWNGSTKKLPKNQQTTACLAPQQVTGCATEDAVNNSPSNVYTINPDPGNFFATGPYTISVVKNGFTLTTPNPASFQTSGNTTPVAVTMSPLDAVLDVNVSSSVTAPAPIPDFSQATVTLTPTGNPTSAGGTCPGIPAGLQSTYQGNPLGTGTVPNSQLVQWTSVVPGNYQLSIDLTKVKPSHPVQATGQAFDVCPPVGSAHDSTNLVVQENAVFGKASTTDGSTSGISVTVSQGGVDQTPQVVSGTTQFNFYVATGSLFTVSGDLTGYTTASQSCPVFPPGPPSCHGGAPLNLVLQPTPRTVSVTLTTPNGNETQGSMSLAPVGGGANLPAGGPVDLSTGTATIPNVPVASYDVLWDGVKVSGGNPIVLSVSQPLPPSVDPFAVPVTPTSVAVSLAPDKKATTTAAGEIDLCDATDSTCSTPYLKLSVVGGTTTAQFDAPGTPPTGGPLVVAWRNTAGAITNVQPLVPSGTTTPISLTAN